MAENQAARKFFTYQLLNTSQGGDTVSNLRGDFVERIKKVLAEADLSVLELALRLDVPYTTLQGWLTADKFPRPETYDRVMDRLDEIGQTTDP